MRSTGRRWVRWAEALDAMWGTSLAALKATAEADHPPQGEDNG